MTLSTNRIAHWYQEARQQPPARLLLGVSLVCLAVTLATGLGLFLDPRRIVGEPAWLKPLKFAVSIAIYCATLAWMLTLVQGRRRWVAVAAWASGGALALELGFIALQAARGTSSHFNISTPFNNAVWLMTGSLLPLVFGGAMVVAVLLIFQRGLPPVLAAGIRGGLLVCLIGMGQAMLMPRNTAHTDPTTTMGAHTVGLADGGPGLPITGWSTQGGDLRVAHFVGLHALQVLPLLAWLLQRYAARLGMLARVRLVWLATGAYTAVVGLLTWQALRGLPLLRPDAAVLSVAGLGAGLAAVAVAVVVARDRRAA